MTTPALRGEILLLLRRHPRRAPSTRPAARAAARPVPARVRGCCGCARPRPSRLRRKGPPETGALCASPEQDGASCSPLRSFSITADRSRFGTAPLSSTKIGRRDNSGTRYRKLRGPSRRAPDRPGRAAEPGSLRCRHGFGPTRSVPARQAPHEHLTGTAPRLRDSSLSAPAATDVRQTCDCTSTADFRPSSIDASASSCSMLIT